MIQKMIHKMIQKMIQKMKMIMTKTMMLGGAQATNQEITKNAVQNGVKTITRKMTTRRMRTTGQTAKMTTRETRTSRKRTLMTRRSIRTRNADSVVARLRLHPEEVSQRSSSQERTKTKAGPAVLLAASRRRHPPTRLRLLILIPLFPHLTCRQSPHHLPAVTGLLPLRLTQRQLLWSQW